MRAMALLVTFSAIHDLAVYNARFMRIRLFEIVHGSDAAIDNRDPHARAIEADSRAISGVSRFARTCRTVRYLAVERNVTDVWII